MAQSKLEEAAIAARYTLITRNIYNDAAVNATAYRCKK